VMETNKVEVRDEFQLLRQIRVKSDVVDEDARVDVVGLTLDLARAQVWNIAVGLRQTGRRIQERNKLPIEEAVKSAREVVGVQNGIEPSSSPVGRFVVSRSV